MYVTLHLIAAREGVVASQADHYRRLSLNAQMRAAQATDHSIKDGFEQLAQGWQALAEQAEWLERRYIPLRPLPAGAETATPMLQQEQVQPKKDDKE
jgi:hypothetical protein